MWYINNNKERVEIFNRRPRNLSAGGYITEHPNMPKKWLDEDTIASRLQAGSLVIPTKVMKSGVMDDYLQKHETVGPKTEDKTKLVATVVMPGEYVVHARHAPKVEMFLRRKGIKLPLGS